MFENGNFEKKISERQKSMPIFPACKDLNLYNMLYPYHHETYKQTKNTNKTTTIKQHQQKQKTQAHLILITPPPQPRN